MPNVLARARFVLFNVLCMAMLGGAGASFAAEAVPSAANEKVAAEAPSAATAKDIAAAAKDASSAARDAAAAAKDASAAAKSTSPKKEAQPVDQKYGFWLVAGLLALMAFLFGILFYWQRRIEMAGYFGRIYLETIENIETKRLIAPIQERWTQGAYLSEIFVRPSPRGQQWLDTSENKKPQPDPRLVELAAQLGEDSRYEVERVARSMSLPPLQDGLTTNPFDPWASETRRLRQPVSANLRNRDWRTRPPGLGRSDPTNEPRRGDADTEQAFEMQLNRFSDQAQAWVERAGAQAYSWYQADIEKEKRTAKLQAEDALQVDFSALRGRGPEFVLEFTAIVVIIFAAVILGILGQLDSQQIGTLLAAIAGYVLGKGSARTRSGGSDAPATPQPTKVELSLKTPDSRSESESPDKKGGGAALIGQGS